MKEDKNQAEIFAKDVCFMKIFIFFLIGCLFGTLFEGCVHFVQHGHWSSRKDMIYGPFCTLYGFGLALFVFVLGKHNEDRSLFRTFLCISLLGGIAEFMVGWLLDVTLNVKFWDYSNMAFNIQGKTTIPIMILWGVMGTIFMKWIYPFISNFIEKIPRKFGQIFFSLFLIFMVINMFLSYTAYFRMYQRNQGEEPKSIIGAFYDKVYDNEFMYKHFPILKGD